MEHLRTGGRVLVTGATGAVGPRVVEALLGDAWAVRCLARCAPPPHVLPPSVEIHYGDITNDAAVDRAVRGVDAIVHLAGLLHVTDPRLAGREDFWRVNVEGTSRLVEAAHRADVPRFVFMSTIAVYGSGHADVVDETTAPRPDTPYAESKLLAESVMLDRLTTGGVARGTVIRAAAVYGSRIKGNYARLVHALSRGRFVPVGPGGNRRTLIHDRDLAAAIAVAARHPAAPGRVFNATDGVVHTVRDVIGAICGALGRRPPRFALPAGPMCAIAAMGDGAARLAGLGQPTWGAAVQKYLEDVAVDGRRLQQELGFAPQWDLEAGWAEAVESMRPSP